MPLLLVARLLAEVLDYQPPRSRGPFMPASHAAVLAAFLLLMLGVH